MDIANFIIWTVFYNIFNSDEIIVQNPKFTKFYTSKTKNIKNVKIQKVHIVKISFDLRKNSNYKKN